jgi:hypothetical protein
MPVEDLNTLTELRMFTGRAADTAIPELMASGKLKDVIEDHEVSLGPSL